MHFSSRWKLSVAALLSTAVAILLAVQKTATSEPPNTPSAESRAEPAAPAEPASQQKPPTRQEALEAIPPRPAQTDKGVFPELAPKVRLSFPSWLRDASVTVADPSGQDSPIAYHQGVPVGLASDGLARTRAISDWGKNDADHDDIPNQLDILIGAKKTALNGAKYQGGYKGMAYPGGDVPRTEGVCTDVIVRAVRNAGIDLQKELREDIKAHPKGYPMVDTPDPNIDQRRVRTLLPYFERNWTSLPTDLEDADSLWAPGDVLFMNTMGDDRPDHVGIVSDRVGDSGRPLVINNWTNGYHTQAMDLLDFVPVTHRFRVPHEPLKTETTTELARVLDHYGIDLPDKHRQVVLVLSFDASSSRATLRRFQRSDGDWKAVEDPIEVRLGAAGLGAGRGLYDPNLKALIDKREGDRRSPAGVFSLGTAFGTVDKPYEGNWPWRGVDERDRFVDDPASPHYNSWQRAPESDDGDWDSAEKMAMYRLGLVVRHNLDPVEPGAGSAIFLHSWNTDERPTIGCTGVDRADLADLLGWLDPSKQPVLAQLPQP